LAISFSAPANDRFESPDEPNQAVIRYTFACGFGDCEDLEPCELTAQAGAPAAPGVQETFFVSTPSTDPTACVVISVYDWDEEDVVPEDWEPTQLRAITHAPPAGVDRLDFDGNARVLSWDGVIDQAIDELAAVEHYAVIVGTQDFNEASCKLAGLPESQSGDWAMTCALSDDDGVRESAVTALDLGDSFPFTMTFDHFEPDGVTYAMTVIPVDDHGLGGGMPIGANDVIRYTTPQIYPDTPQLSPERVFSVAGYDVIFSFEAPADDGDPSAADAESVSRYIPLCSFVGRGQACPDPAQAPYSTCDSQGVDFTFYDSEPKAPGEDETLHLIGLPAGGRLCMQLGVLDDYALARIDTDLARETWTLAAVSEISLYDNPSAVTELVVTTGDASGTLNVDFTAPDDGAGGYVTKYEYLVGSELPSPLPGCDERVQNTWLSPQAPGVAESRPLQNLEPERETHFAIRSLRLANGFTFCSDWTTALPAETGCAKPLRIDDLVCGTLVEDGSISLNCLFSAPGDLPETPMGYGLVDRYEGKVVTGTLNDANFESVGEEILGLPAPLAAGQNQTFTLTSVEESTYYEIALRSHDARGCTSLISNVVTVDTPDITPPAQIDMPTVSSPATDGGPVPIVAVTPSTTLNDAWSGNQLIDGDASTSWASELSFERREETLVLNLGSPQRVDRITLKPDALYQDFFPKTFRVEGTDAITFEGQGELLVKETSLLIDDESTLEWAFPPMEARLLKVTTTEPQQSFGIFYSILAEAQVLRARPDAASLNINVRLPGDDANDGRAECLVTYYSNAAFNLNELPNTTRSCATIPALIQLDGDRLIRTQVSRNLGLSGALQTVSLTGLPGEEPMHITIVALDEAGNVGQARELPLTVTSPIQPAAVSDLSGTPLSTDQIQLTFTAPADDPGASWPALHLRGLDTLELRYTSESLTSLNFEAIPSLEVIEAAAPGQRQVVVIDGLEPSTEYRFAMVSKDQSGETSSLSNVAVIRTQDADDAIPPGAVADLEAFTPSIVPQPIGNVITAADTDLSLVDSDVATVWQPSLDGDAVTTTLILPEPQVIGSVELTTLGGFEDWQPGQVSATCTLTGPVSRELGTVNIDQTQGNQRVEFPTHQTCLRVELTFTNFGSFNGEPIVAIGDLLFYTGTPTEPSLILRWTASGDDGFSGQANRVEVRAGECDDEDDSNIKDSRLLVSFNDPLEAGLLERRHIMLPPDFQAITPLCLGIETIDEIGQGSDSNVARVNP
jgi:hypothetical protein